MATKVQVETVSEELLGPFMALTATEYHDLPVNDPAVVRWRHFDNPVGPSTAVELVDGDTRFGRMWIQVLPWSVRGQATRAANPIDFLIREDRRKLPAFLSLFKSTMSESLARADLVFHTSNPVTDDLYRKLMKFEPVTELDGAVLPTRPFATAAAGGMFDAKLAGRAADALVSGVLRLVGAAATLSGLMLSAQAPGAAEQESVVAALRCEEQVCGTRSREQRAWRFRGAGPIAYEQLWIMRRGKPVGYVVTTDRDLDGIAGRFVVDLVLPGKRRRLDPIALWLLVAGRAAAAHRDAVFFFCNRANARLASLVRLPMYAVGRERLPQRIPVFVRTAGHPGGPDLDGVDWSSGYFVLSDFDLF